MMNDLTLRVDDPAGLISYGKEMDGYAENYITQINDIYRVLEVLNESWSGAKNQKFMDTLKGYEKSFKAFGTNLKSFADLIVKTGEGYTNWDK